ncbi:hypothetical protein D3C87_342720 [compost metagenome]
MKKTLLSLFLLGSVFSNAQNIYSYGFSGVTADLTTAGWERTNQSTSPTSVTQPTPALWTIGAYTPVVVNAAATNANPFGDQVYTAGQTSPTPNGQAGGENSFALVNFRSTTSTSATAGTISNWLITPVITVQNGDIVTFYSRKGTSGTTDYPDRLELRMSTATTTVVPSTGPTDVGSFTTVGVTINPTLVAGFVYPKTWTQYTYTVSGLTGATPVKFGFRYFVTAGGPNGNNSDIIGIDTFSVDRTLNTSDFFANNFSMYPNPSTGLVNLASKNNVAINTIQITDLNGRVVRNINTNSVSETQINISDLTTGMYFLNIQTDLGSGTTKIVKN